ncbi:MAG: sortase [Acidimicrobiales bacterium]|nr:sortase [Acidimicrobiales bacterium]
MQGWRALGAVGRALMRLGVLVLLFVAFQLWGTGLLTDRAQDELARDFDAQLEQAQSVTTLPPGTSAPGTAPVDLPVPEPGQAIGRVVIPTVDVDFVFVQGVELRYLRDGPGHFPQTPLPGQPGNAALAGHRTTYAAPFHRLDEVAPGDEVTVETVQGTFTYRVDAHEAGDGEPIGHFIVAPSAVEILDQDGTNRLTLMACHPKYSARQRIVVTATLVSEPAPPTPRPDATLDDAVTVDAAADPLAGGDPSAWPLAIAWSLAAIVAWFLTWLAGRLLRDRQGGWAWGLPPYVIGVPVVAVLLFMAFQDIARLLPAAY